MCLQCKHIATIFMMTTGEWSLVVCHLFQTKISVNSNTTATYCVNPFTGILIMPEIVFRTHHYAGTEIPVPSPEGSPIEREIIHLCLAGAPFLGKISATTSLSSSTAVALRTRIVVVVDDDDLQGIQNTLQQCCFYLMLITCLYPACAILLHCFTTDPFAMANPSTTTTALLFYVPILQLCIITSLLLHTLLSSHTHPNRTTIIASDQEGDKFQCFNGQQEHICFFQKKIIMWIFQCPVSLYVLLVIKFGITATVLRSNTCPPK